MNFLENYLWHIYIPLILSNVLHMAIVRRNIFSTWAIPLSVLWFGPNKTWRGFIVLTILNALFFYVVNLIYPLFSSSSSILYGCILGLTYMLFELPNSMMKRYLHIPSGESSQKFPLLFYLFDKADSALGISLVSKLLFGFTWMEAGILFLGSVIVHILFSFLVVFIGMKERF